MDYFWFLVVFTAITLIHVTISAIYSKTSLAIFVILFTLFNVVVSTPLATERDDKYDDSPYEYLLAYWFVFLFCLASSISVFSCSNELKLRLISLSLVGGFLSIFDLITDLILIITWFSEVNISG